MGRRVITEFEAEFAEYDLSHVCASWENISLFNPKDCQLYVLLQLEVFPRKGIGPRGVKCSCLPSFF